VIFDFFISQSSVATQLRCGGIFNNHFVANFSLSSVTKDFNKKAQLTQRERATAVHV